MSVSERVTERENKLLISRSLKLSPNVLGRSKTTATATYIGATTIVSIFSIVSSVTDVITRTADRSDATAAPPPSQSMIWATTMEHGGGRARPRPREGERSDGRTDGRTHINLKKKFRATSGAAAAAVRMAVCGIFVEPFLF